MNYELMESLISSSKEIKVTATKDSLCIEDKVEMVILRDLEELKSLISMLYDVKYWWEQLEPKETK